MTSSPALRDPPAAREWAARRMQRARLGWLAGGGDWPLRIPLGQVTEASARAAPERVRAWQRAWLDWAGPGDVCWTEKRWPSLGTQRLPTTLLLSGPAEAAALTDETPRWSRAVDRLRRLHARDLLPGDPAARDLAVLEDWADADFERLQTLLAWLRQHPISGRYIRELPVPGLDSKWLERNAGTVRHWLARLREDAGDADLHRLAGLRRPPVRMRLRLLDAALRRQIGGLGDIEAPIEELAALPIAPRALIVVENLQTGLAFPDLPGIALIMGLGYAVDGLAALPWIDSRPVLYWGDLDTHGFAILDRLRAHLPHARSLLMDAETLLAHRTLWTREATPAPRSELPRLTPAEHAVYTGLLEHRWGECVRLEQERIAWEAALMATERSLSVLDA